MRVGTLYNVSVSMILFLHYLEIVLKNVLLGSAGLCEDHIFKFFARIDRVALKIYLADDRVFLNEKDDIHSAFFVGHPVIGGYKKSELEYRLGILAKFLLVYRFTDLRSNYAHNVLGYDFRISPDRYVQDDRTGEFGKFWVLRRLLRPVLNCFLDI